MRIPVRLNAVRAGRAVISVVSLLSVVAAVAVVVPGASAAAATPRWWGATAAGIPSDLSVADGIATTAGNRPGVLMWYVPWSANTAFPAADAAAVTSWGATPEITWEPWDPSAGVNQPAYSLTRIARGSFDKYLRSWAASVKSWGKPLRLRFAHEMNGNWYPWAEGVNGNPSGSYVAAWRHVVGVFASVGVTNVTWIWSPNVPYSGSTALSALFPGDSYVGEVALDGYNWGTTQSWSSWQSFHDVFADGVSQLGALSRRPLSIGEVGSAEQGGDKAQWMTDMWSTLASWPQVRGLTWFDYNKETDWRIDSSSTSASAFAGGVGNYLLG